MTLPGPHPVLRAVTSRGLPVHGPGAREYRDHMVGGWDALLASYVAAAAG